MSAQSQGTWGLGLGLGLDKSYWWVAQPSVILSCKCYPDGHPYGDPDGAQPTPGLAQPELGLAQPELGLAQLELGLAQPELELAKLELGLAQPSVILMVILSCECHPDGHPEL